MYSCSFAASLQYKYVASAILTSEDLSKKESEYIISNHDNSMNLELGNQELFSLELKNDKELLSGKHHSNVR